MQFKSLEDKCLYYRGLSDYKLLPNSYVIVMLDGRSFSHMIKNKFQKPFDRIFIDMMNETAKYVCKNVQGAKFAYVQSDEISIVLTDFDTPTTDAFFGNRLCKLQSIIASLATSKFNQLMMTKLFDNLVDEYGNTPLLSCEYVMERISNGQIYQFDCKAWNVPTYNDVFAWLLYRQIDCIRNSKQQTAQTYLSHKELMKRNTDEQVALLKERKDIDWNEFDDDLKFGRFIYKVKKTLYTEDDSPYTRHVWEVNNGYPLSDEYYRNMFHSLNVIPKQL